MLLKDTTKIDYKHKNEISIIIPDKIVIQNITIKKSYIATMKYNSKKYIGTIGNSFFKEFIIIFDYDNNKLYLKPNSENVKILNFI